MSDNKRFKLMLVLFVLAGMNAGNVSLAQPKSATSTRLEHLPAPAIQGKFHGFQDLESDVCFEFPADWTQSKTEDKDCVAKFSGVTSSGLNGEVVLNRNTDEGMTAQDLKRVVERYIFPKLTDFHVVQEKKVAIGSRGKLPADLEDVSFTMNGMKIQQRYVFFDSQKGTHSMIFTAPAGHFNGITPLFNHILMSVSVGDLIRSTGTQTKVRTGPSASAEQAVVLKRYQAGTLPVSFEYPEGWKVEQNVHHDQPVAVSGKNAKGYSATIVLNRGEMHPGLSIEDVADGLEKEYFEPQKSFHRVERQSKNFGVSAKVSGVVQEQSFDKDGMPVKQMVAMFSHADKAYALSLVAPGWKDSDVHQLFAKVLSSVQIKE